MTMKLTNYKLVIITLSILFNNKLHSQVSQNLDVSRMNLKHQYESASFNLYPTESNSIFIKLDTRNGKMWLAQYSIDSEKRGVVELNDVSLVLSREESNQRFILVPTKNFFTFILMDQIDGRMWQVQWSVNPSERMVLPIE
jgi:hypothetical protein